MMNALWVSKTGLSAQDTQLSTISNNLANMSTTGYNARRAEFADLHYQQITSPGAINATDGTDEFAFQVAHIAFCGLNGGHLLSNASRCLARKR